MFWCGRNISQRESCFLPTECRWCRACSTSRMLLLKFWPYPLAHKWPLEKLQFINLTTAYKATTRSCWNACNWTQKHHLSLRPIDLSGWTLVKIATSHCFLERLSSTNLLPWCWGSCHPSQPWRIGRYSRLYLSVKGVCQEPDLFPLLAITDLHSQKSQEEEEGWRPSVFSSPESEEKVNRHQLICVWEVLHLLSR